MGFPGAWHAGIYEGCKIIGADPMRRSGTSVDRGGEVEPQLQGDRTKSGVTDHDKQPVSAHTIGPGCYRKRTVTEKVLAFGLLGPHQARRKRSRCVKGGGNSYHPPE